MKSKKIKNPLIKRIPKELAGDWKKYLVVFLFLVLTIGFVSGMYVANESMLTAADEGITRYKQEDGHFELKEKADSSLIEAIESGEKADIPGLAEENTADGDNDDSEENGKSDDDLDNSKKTSVTVYENSSGTKMKIMTTMVRAMERSVSMQRQMISTLPVF